MKINIYTEIKNPYCGMTKQWLDVNNYEYTEDVLNNEHEIQGLYESLKITYNVEVSTLPQILIDGEYVGGFDQLLRSKLV